MTDIVERLRSSGIIGTPTMLLLEAASEIERLRAELLSEQREKLKLGAEVERLRGRWGISQVECWTRRAAIRDDV